MSRLAIAAAVALVLALAGAIVFGGPIIGYWKQRTADAEATAEHNADEAKAGALTVEGERTLSTAAAETSSSSAELRRGAHAIDVETRRDPAVATRIPPGELARLRAHDRGLCASAVVRCDDIPAAAPRGPGPGAGDVSP